MKMENETNDILMQFYHTWITFLYFLICQHFINIVIEKLVLASWQNYQISDKNAWILKVLYPNDSQINDAEKSNKIGFFLWKLVVNCVK